MTGLNEGMLGFAGLAFIGFIGLFVLFALRYRVAPQAAPVVTAPRVPAGRPPTYTAWRLMSREYINPGSERRPAYRLRFEPEDALPHWQPGATVQIYPAAWDDMADASVAAREYPVASLPSEGGIELLVRNEGEMGSQWLCEGLATGQRAGLSLSSNPDFASPADKNPLIVIANGVGVAGARAYIKARAPGTRNWLIFGEHMSAFDMLLGPEIADWVATGHLERCDLVFARDGAQRRHVCDQIHDSANPLYDWVLADAAIYVCGRQGGFLIDVDSSLSDVLGADVLDELKSSGLYKQQSY